MFGKIPVEEDTSDLINTGTTKEVEMAKYNFRYFIDVKQHIFQDFNNLNNLNNFRKISIK